MHGHGDSSSSCRVRRGLHGGEIDGRMGLTKWKLFAGRKKRVPDGDRRLMVVIVMRGAAGWPLSNLEVGHGCVSGGR